MKEKMTKSKVDNGVRKTGKDGEDNIMIGKM